MIDLVGIPYKDGGLTPEEGFDCYGLVRWVLNIELGLLLPETPPSPVVWGRYVKIFRQQPLPAFKKYDVTAFAEVIPALANHVGVLVSPRDFLHAGAIYGGVVCENIGRWRSRVVGIGRPRAD